MKLLQSKDFLAGLVFLAIGVAAIWFAREYPFGNAMRMGSGYFPSVLGGVLALFGVVLASRGIRAGSGESIGWRWRPVACVAGAMLLFGFLLPRIGLVPTLFVMFFAAAAGGSEFRWREVLVLTLAMTAFAVGVFVYVLKLPFQVLPGVYFLL